MVTKVQGARWFACGLAVGLLSATSLCHVPLAHAEPAERRDPAGVTGISPFAAALARGDAAFVARDLPAALEAYREAVRVRPKDVKGHLRMAAVLRAQANPEGANAVLETALAIAADAEQQRPVLLQRAEAAERAFDLARAQKAREAYAALNTFTQPSSAQRGILTHTEIAEARLKQVAAARQRAEQYAAVRARIAQRMHELEASTRAAPALR